MKINRLVRQLPRACWFWFAVLLYGLLHLFGAMQFAVTHLPGKVAFAVPYHMVFYAGLTVLTWLSMRQPGIAKVVLLVTCAGALDELHQMFLPFRGARVSDVLLDGAAAWIAAYCMARIGAKVHGKGTLMQAG